VGMFSAIPALILKTIFIAPLLWFVILHTSIWRRNEGEERSNGVVYTLALGMGFSVFYTHPIQIPIPAFTSLLGKFLELQNKYAEITIWPWQAGWWWILGGVTFSAVILGFLLDWARRSSGGQRILRSILGLSLSVAILAIFSFVLMGK
jgi:hypothetical protein